MEKKSVYMEKERTKREKKDMNEWTKWNEMKRKEYTYH